MLFGLRHTRAAAADATRAVKPISLDEAEFLRWNSDPFDLDGGSGGSETDPGDCARVMRPAPMMFAVAPHYFTRLLHPAVLDGKVRASVRVRFNLAAEANGLPQVLQTALGSRLQRV